MGGGQSTDRLCFCTAGELRELDPAPASLFASFLLAQRERRDMVASWPSMLGMLPWGGASVWGSTSSAPDDDPTASHQSTFGCASA